MLQNYKFVFFQAEDGIRDRVRSRGLGDVYKRQPLSTVEIDIERTRNALLKELDPQFSAEGPSAIGGGAPGQGDEAMSSPRSPAEAGVPGEKKELKTPALKAFGRDLTELARNNAISDAVVFAGDEDIRIAVQLAQSHGVRVHLLGIRGVAKNDNQSPSLQKESDTVSIWHKSEVASFLKQVAEPKAPPEKKTQAK